MQYIIRCLCSSSNNNNNNNETEVNTPALCQHPQVDRHHGDLVQLLARGREHGYQGLPVDIHWAPPVSWSRRWPEWASFPLLRGAWPGQPGAWSRPWRRCPAWTRGRWRLHCWRERGGQRLEGGVSGDLPMWPPSSPLSPPWLISKPSTVRKLCNWRWNSARGTRNL